MNTTVTVVNGADLNVGELVIHPRTRRTVEILWEQGWEGDGLRRFMVVGPRGGYDALVIGETSPIEVIDR